MFSTAFQRARDWLHSPFVGTVDPVHLFLLTGIVIVAALFWARVLSYFPKELEV